jgi:hypothetical protein
MGKQPKKLSSMWQISQRMLKGSSSQSHVVFATDTATCLFFRQEQCDDTERGAKVPSDAGT